MFYEELRIKQGLFLYIILSIKDSLQQQIHYNGNILGNKCCRNEGSLYVRKQRPRSSVHWCIPIKALEHDDRRL